jgi:hypothetical protein
MPQAGGDTLQVNRSKISPGTRRVLRSFSLVAGRADQLSVCLTGESWRLFGEKKRA